MAPLSDSDARTRLNHLKEALKGSEKCQKRYGIDKYGRIAERAAEKVAVHFIPFVRVILMVEHVANDAYKDIEVGLEIKALRDIIKTFEDEPYPDQKALEDARKLLHHAEWLEAQGVGKTLLDVIV